MLKRILADEKARFLAIGLANTVVLYLLYAFFYWLLGPSLYLLGYVISYAIAIVSGFTLQRLIVFRAKGYLVLDFSRYVLVQLGSFGTNFFLLILFVEVLALSPLLGQAVAMVITVIGSYFAHRYFTFRRKRAPEEITP